METPKIPSAVRNCAAYFIGRFGNHLKYIGEQNGSQMWQFCFPDELTVGLPVVYLYKNRECTLMDGEDAASLLASLFDKD